MRSVHARLRKAAEVARVATDDDRRSLLFELIEGHEQRLDEALDEASPAAPEAVMKTWLQFPQNEKLESLVRSLPEDAQPGIPLDEVIDRVLRAERDLARAYELLAAHSGAERVRSFFESMATLENDARRRYIRAELESHDA